MPDFIFILSGAPLPDTANRQILTSNEFGKDLNNKLMVEQLQRAYPKSSISVASITLLDYIHVISRLVHSSVGRSAVFLNLCDGIETDGYPGYSVVEYLEKNGIPFTGAGTFFYANSTSKTILKTMMLKAQVPTLPFVVVRPDHFALDLQEASRVVGYPLIIKPSVSYGSMMISTSSVVDDENQASLYITGLEGYKDEIFLESFLAGREFTVLCSGDEKQGVRVYTPAERVFQPNLKERERILTFDICWDGCDPDENKTGEVPVQPYWYEAAPADWQESLKSIRFANEIELARDAYVSVGGTGYGRVDIRTKTVESKDGFVLEVNANCGLAFGRLASSLGEILILSNVEPSEFCQEIVKYATNRFQH